MNQPQHDPHESDAFQEVFRELETLPETHPDLAEQIFTQTRGVLARRRWLGRTRIVVACLLCYAVGIGSGWLLKPGAPQIANELIKVVPPERVKTLPTDDRQVATAESPGTTTTQQQPAQIRSAAPAPRRSYFESYRLAGDRQLFEQGNIRVAADCYRRALTRATEQELQVAIDRDSWLLISLKQSRIEELKHVRQKRV